MSNEKEEEQTNGYLLIFSKLKHKVKTFFKNNSFTKNNF